MKVFACLSAVVLSAAIAGAADRVVATASSSSNFDIAGAAVDVAGVPSWLVFENQSVAARSSAVVLRLQDGSSITLAPGSRVQFGSSGGSRSADLVSGSMDFSLARGSSLRLFSASHPVGGRTGTIATSGSPVHALLVHLPPPPPQPPAPISAR